MIQLALTFRRRMKDEKFIQLKGESINQCLGFRVAYRLAKIT